MTGNDLADALEEMLRKRPDIARTKVGMILRGKRNGIDDFRNAKKPKAVTVAKVLAFIADPPSDAKHIRRTPVRQPCSERRRAGIRKAITRKAKALLQGDPSALTSGGRINAAVGAAVIRLQVMQAAQERMNDPIEQALRKLRSSRRIVYRASVYGGPHNRFYISGRGRQTISERELMQIAERA